MIKTLITRRLENSVIRETIARFLLDSRASIKGVHLFYLRADEIRRCDQAPCYDALNFLFSSLHRIDMSFRQSSSYPGNALDSVDGNTNAVLPIVLQFGGLEVSRAFVPRRRSLSDQWLCGGNR